MPKFSFELLIDVESESLDKARARLHKRLTRVNLPYALLSAENPDTGESWDEAELLAMDGKEA